MFQHVVDTKEKFIMFINFYNFMMFLSLSVAMLSVAMLSVAMLLAPPFPKVEKVDF